jgi:hypothetical protein
VRSTSSALADVLAGSFARRFVGRLFVAGREVLGAGVDLPLVDVSLSWDGTAKIVGSGKASILYEDDWGRSAAPREFESWLAPFNSWLHVALVIEGGPYSERVELGRFAIEAPKESARGRAVVTGSAFVTGQRIDVSLRDAFSISDRERLVSLAQIPRGSSAVWALEHVLGLPVTGVERDAMIPTPVTLQDSRLDAAYDLAQYLGGTPYVRSDGTVGVRPTAWPDRSAELTAGDGGTVVSVDVNEWDASGVFNQVVVRAEDDDQAAVLADVRVTTGRLKWGPMSDPECWGRIPYFYSSPYLTTKIAAAAYARQLLAQVSRLRAVAATVVTAPDPRLEVGDVVSIPVDGVPTDGRITKLDLTAAGLTAVVSIG